MNKLLRYLLLICVVVLCGGASYGQTKETYMFSQFTTSDKVTLTGTHCTITLTKGKSTPPAWSTKNSEARVYAGGSLIVDSKKLITKIVYTFKNNSGTFGSVTPEGYNTSTHTWESSTGSNTVTFKMGGTSGNYGFKKLEITYINDGSSKTSTTLSFGEGLNGKTYNCIVGDAFVAPIATLTPAVEGAEITYSSDKPEVATVNASTGAVTLGTTAGTAVITASYAGNDKYEASTASYTINLTKPFEVEDGVFDFTESCDYGSGLTPTNGNNADYATSSKWTAKNVSFETSEGRGVRWWINGAANELRVYGNTKFKISVPEDKFITLIDIDGVNTGLSVDCGTFKSGKWSGWSQTVVFTNGNARKDIKKITVKYIAKESVTPTTNGYATFACSYPVNYSENELKACTIKVDEDNQKVAYTEFTGVVPAGKAVLVSGTEGQKYELAPATEKADATFATDLKVSDGTIKSDGTNFYGFTTKDGVSGFVRVANGVTIPKGKGYLQFTGNTAAAPVFYSINIGGGTTGIGQVEVEKASENSAIYNLAGQRVDASYKGVVIKYGKKYVNK